MNRLALSTLLAGLLSASLAAPAHAQRGRVCPFLMQQQLQMQVQMQPQMMSRQEVMLQQRQMMQDRRALLTSQQRGVTSGRTGGLQVNRHTTTQTRHTTSTRLITSRFRATRVRIARAPARPGSGRGMPPARVSIRTMTHSRILLERITRTTQTTRSTFTVRRSSVSSARRTTSVRVRPTSQVLRGTTTTAHRHNSTEVRHRPSVQVRVRMSMTCGNCHGCKQGRPTMINQPGLPPAFPTGLPRPPMAGIVGRPPVRPDFIIGQPKPRPLPPIAILRPPRLPILAQVPARPGKPRLDLLIALPVRPPALLESGTESPGKSDADRPTTTTRSVPTDGLTLTGKPTAIDPPELPTLQGSLALGRPLLIEGKTGAPTVRPTTARPTELLPGDVAVAPAFRPLPSSPTARDLTLLPALAGDDLSGASKTAAPARPALELVLQPPPLPPLPDSAVR
jgi:hypothetical protein